MSDQAEVLSGTERCWALMLYKWECMSFVTVILELSNRDIYAEIEISTLRLSCDIWQRHTLKYPKKALIQGADRIQHLRLSPLTSPPPHLDCIFFFKLLPFLLLPRSHTWTESERNLTTEDWHLSSKYTSRDRLFVFLAVHMVHCSIVGIFNLFSLVIPIPFIYYPAQGFHG